ncbi:MAG: Spy/CpxP family protein refolding chaperone [Deltaproteobacteria bacterium]|nr:Spy/CpxP family protein refolding chaperone [Deltaproteobacteria bacterium]
MKKTATTIAIVLLVSALAVPALARSKGRGPETMGKPGRGMTFSDQTRTGYARFANLTEEQRNQLKELHQKFFDKTAPTRIEHTAKKAELHILLKTSNPDTGKAKAVQKEISDLEAKLAQERIDLMFEARKISPDLPLGKGFGMSHGPTRGGFGPAPGKGHGMRPGI